MSLCEDYQVRAVTETSERAREIVAKLDERERRAVVHYAVYKNLNGSCYGMQGKGWCDAGAELSEDLVALRDLGVLQVHFHEGERWWKARLAGDLGPAVASTLASVECGR